MESTVAITVNGEKQEISTGATVTALLAKLGLNSGRVAIERNLKIFPRAEWAATVVQPGDRYEIVQFVGGG